MLVTYDQLVYVGMDARRISLDTGNNYLSGSDLEVQSVRDILNMAPCTIRQVCDKTGMPREKVIDCMKVLIREKVLVKTRNKYSILKE